MRDLHADLELERARREPPDLAEPADAVDLGGGKDREHLVEPRLNVLNELSSLQSRPLASARDL